MILLSNYKNGFNNYFTKFFYSNYQTIKNIKNYINNKSTYLLDIRKEQEIKKGFIKNSLITPINISYPIIPQIINKNKKIILINNEQNKKDNSKVINILNLLGYNNNNIIGSYYINNIYNEINNKFIINKINFYPLKNNDNIINLINNKKFIIDIREPNEYKEIGILKSSFLLPISLIKYNYKLIPRNKKIYILCLSGKRALIIYSYLLRKGYNEKDLYIIDGGISNLIKLNFPLIKY